MSLSRAKNIFTPVNINFIIILTSIEYVVHYTGWICDLKDRTEKLSVETELKLYIIIIIIIIITMSWIRAKVSFALLRSALLCLRGSRCTRRAPMNITDNDFEIDKEPARF